MSFIPSLSFGSGLPAFREVGFTGSLPTIWDSTIQSLVFSMPQIQYIRAARAGLESSQLALKDAREQAALDASTAYIELDTVDRELEAAREQEQDAARLVEIEQQRAEAGVDPLSTLLQAQLTAAQLKLSRLHLETRAATLVKTIGSTHGFASGFDYSRPREHSRDSGGDGRSHAIAYAGSRIGAVRRSQESEWLKAIRNTFGCCPKIGFGAQYNRNTTLLNNIRLTLTRRNRASRQQLQQRLFHQGSHYSISDFMPSRRDCRRGATRTGGGGAGAAAERFQIAQLSASLRELDAQAEVASLKQQIAAEQLKSVEANLEPGNGASSGPGAQPQPSPTAEQQARIDERQKYAGCARRRTRADARRGSTFCERWATCRTGSTSCIRNHNPPQGESSFRSREQETRCANCV